MMGEVQHPFDQALLGGLEARAPLGPELARMVLRLSAALREGEVSIEVPSVGEMQGAQDARLRWDPDLSEPVFSPLVVFGGRLYFGRYFEDLRRLAHAIEQRRNTLPEPAWHPARETLEGLSPGQAQAIELAGRHAITFVTGGPGTGKTHLIQSLVASMAPHDHGLLLAPTGKAAGRLPLSDRVEVKTIHRALGLRPGSLRPPVHHEEAPFKAQLVVVDEVSMVGLSLLRQVVEAVAPGARLVLVGDKDQLQSVAAGSVLGPVLQESLEAQTPTDCLAPVARLRASFRFGGPLAGLASAAIEGDETTFFDRLNAGGTGIHWHEYQDVRDLRSRLRGSSSQILCAHRRGPFGSEQINAFLVRQRQGQSRPIILRRTDPNLGLFNGDIGLLAGDHAHFKERRVPRALLPVFESAEALTIHQSQGSEFDAVGVVLPPADSPLLSRELLYTGVTRARDDLTIFAPKESLKPCLRRAHSSAPGLADLLRQIRQG